MLEKYIFTFGCGQKQAGYCQPIFAKDYEEARNKMFELHGAKWAFQYTGERWDAIKNNPNRIYTIETEMDPVYCETENEKI
jgi:hypothetical protein